MDGQHLSAHAHAYVPRSPSPSGYAPKSPNLSAAAPEHSSSTPQRYDAAYNFPPFTQAPTRESFSVPSHFDIKSELQFNPPPIHDPAYQDYAQYPSQPQYSYPTYEEPVAQSEYSQQAQSRPRGRPPKRKMEDDGDWHPTADGPDGSHPAKLPRQRSSLTGSSTANSTANIMRIPPPDQRLVAPGEREGVVIKTKFPVARIKRLVQADEDIGKVAQVTPVVVGRALELFMTSLALQSAEQARSRNSKRITGYHLKQTILGESTFDFLSDIVAKIPDAPAANSQSQGQSQRGKKHSNGGFGSEDDFSDGDSEDAAPRRKKSKSSGAGRKRRKDSDEDGS